jgi:hypothetical protein
VSAAPPALRIDVAARQLADGERALAVAIAELSALPRAHKMVTTRVVEDAVARVRALRSAVLEVRVEAASTTAVS